MEKKYFPEEIRSDRITLKKHSSEIAQMMFDFVDQDRERLRQFLPWVDLTKTVADEQGYIAMTHRKWTNYEMFDYGIYRIEDDQYMGNVGVHTIAWDHERCEFGYWILGDFQGQGYVSESVRALEKSCFELGFHRIEIHCSSRNMKSAKVPVRCGFALEARLKEDSNESGEKRDTLIFGKVKNPRMNALGLVNLDFVYLFTSNLAASREWYAKVFEIEPTIEIENFVEFRPGGRSGLCLHPADSKSPANAGGSVGYWRVTNFSQVLKHFEGHGAIIYRWPLDIGNGESICQLLDPTGNIIGIVGPR